MISQRSRGLFLLHFALQTALAVCVFWLWVYVNLTLMRDQADLDLGAYSLCCGLLIAGFLVDFLRWNPTKQNLVRLQSAENRHLCLRQVSTALTFITFYLAASHDYGISRVFLFSFVPVLTAFLYASNRYLPSVLATFVFGARRRERTVVLGSIAGAEKLREWLDHKLDYGLEEVGLVTNEPERANSGGLPILGSLAQLESILLNSGASQLLVAELPKSAVRLSRLATLCDKLGIRLLVRNDLEERLGRQVSFVQDDGHHFLSVRDEPLECPLNQILKRAVDVLIALPVVVFVLPLVSLVVAVFHRIQSPGPLFFRQARGGMGRGEFMIYKYRSMHANVANEALQASRDDNRIFAAGRWLRRMSIDELPQFINVLKGEMSIVGPRPHLSVHDEAFSNVADFYRVRSLIKPGITGLAQVRGFRGEAARREDVVNRVKSDIFYLENWSVVMDLQIILRTAFQMPFPPRTAF